MKLTVSYKLYDKITVVVIKNKYAIFFRILWLSEMIIILKLYKAEIVIRVA